MAVECVDELSDDRVSTGCEAPPELACAPRIEATRGGKVTSGPADEEREVSLMCTE
jgi:hypothetical protein